MRYFCRHRYLISRIRISLNAWLPRKYDELFSRWPSMWIEQGEKTAKETIIICANCLVIVVLAAVMMAPLKSSHFATQKTRHEVHLACDCESIPLCWVRNRRCLDTEKELDSNFAAQSMAKLLLFNKVDLNAIGSIWLFPYSMRRDKQTYVCVCLHFCETNEPNFRI